MEKQRRYIHLPPNGISVIIEYVYNNAVHYYRGQVIRYIYNNGIPSAIIIGDLKIQLGPKGPYIEEWSGTIKTIKWNKTSYANHTHFSSFDDVETRQFQIKWRKY